MTLEDVPVTILAPLSLAQRIKWKVPALDDEGRHNHRFISRLIACPEGSRLTTFMNERHVIEEQVAFGAEFYLKLRLALADSTPELA